MELPLVVITILILIIVDLMRGILFIALIAWCSLWMRRLLNSSHRVAKQDKEEGAL